MELVLFAEASKVTILQNLAGILHIKGRLTSADATVELANCIAEVGHYLIKIIDFRRK